MKNILSYLKNIFKVLIWPIIFIIGQFLLVAIFSLIFSTLKFNELKKVNDGVSDKEFNVIFNDYVSSDIYQNELHTFISSNSILITVITFIIFGYIFYRQYKIYNDNYKDKMNCNNILILVILGFCLSISFNLIVGGLNNIVHFTNNYDSLEINIFVYLICTGILGPILEEILFRGIVYNKLKVFNKNMKAIILTSLIFAFFHQTLVQVVYAFCLSFILIYVYEKYKTLKAPIIIHITSNIINYFVCNLINQNIMLFNIILLLISVIVLFVIKLKIIKQDL